MNFKKKSLMNLILLLFISIVSYSSNDFQNLKIPEIQFQKFSLKNGLKLYVIEDHSVPLVNFSIWYKVGSVDEVKGKTGISHLLEHNMFLGTNALDKNEVHFFIEKVGGINNAATTYDCTNYYEMVPSAMLELAIAIEADRMRNLKVDENEFEREKQVVMQERRLSLENNFYQSSIEQIKSKAFGDEPLGHEVIGWMEDLKTITYSDLKEYYNKYYAPNNAYIIISGDVNPKYAFSLVEKYFGAYEPYKIDRKEVKFSKQTEEKFITIEKLTRLPFMSIIYKTPEGNHPDIQAIDILFDILVNAENSRLNKSLYFEKEIILASGGSVLPLRIPSFSIFYAIPKTPALMDSIKYELDKEIKNIIDFGVDEKELQIAKKRVIKEEILKMKSIDNQAEILGANLVRYDDEKEYKKVLERYMKITSADIQRVAKEYFLPENRTVGYIIPQKEGETK